MSKNPGDFPNSHRKLMSTIPRNRNIATKKDVIPMMVLVYHFLSLYKFKYQMVRLLTFLNNEYVLFIIDVMILMNTFL